MLRDDQPPLDDALADAVRRACVRPLDETTASEHVNAMLAAAATAAAPAGVGTSSRRRRRGWRLGLAAGAATLLTPVGLAVAGVGLPDAVEQPFKAVGIELPHQAHPTPDAPSAPAQRPATPPPPVPATARPLAPPGRAGRPQSGRGRATGHKPAAKAAPPQSRRNSAPAQRAPGRPAKPKTVPRRNTVPPRHTPAGPKPKRG